MNQSPEYLQEALTKALVRNVQISEDNVRLRDERDEAQMKLAKALQTETPPCPHCGSTKDTWFSRTEPMGFVCPDCGQDVDEPPEREENTAEPDNHRGIIPDGNFLEWSHEAGYSTCTSDIQLALWEAWQAGAELNRLSTTNLLLKPTELVVDELASLVREFFAMLDQEEQSDNGREFHPTYICSCRIQHNMKLNQILPRMKELAHNTELYAKSDITGAGTVFPPNPGFPTRENATLDANAKYYEQYRNP